MRRWFVVLASVAIVLTLVRAAGFREVGGVWSSVETRGILLSVSCYYAAIVVRVLAWRRLLRGDSPSAVALGPPLVLGIVLGHLLPAKSGEPVSAVLVSRSSGLPLARTLSVLTAERALHLLALFATFLPAATVYAGEVLEIRRTIFVAWILFGALAAGAFLASPVVRRMIPVAARVPRIGPAARGYLGALAEILGDRRGLAPLLGLATLFWLLQYLSLWAILDAGGLSVNPVGAAAVSGAAVLGGTLSLLPLGTQDGISAVVLRGLGVPLTRGFSLALFHTMLSLGGGLVLVALAAFWARRRRGPD